MYARCIICGDAISKYLYRKNISLGDEKWKEVYRAPAEQWLNADELETSTSCKMSANGALYIDLMSDNKTHYIEMEILTSRFASRV